MSEYSYKVEQSSNRGQDCVSIFEVNDRIIIMLADGAGGYKGAKQVSEKYISLMQEKLNSDSISEDPLVLERIMKNIDIELLRHSNGSETTAIIVIVKDSKVWGASVGDSKCWLFNKEFNYELTANQYRKPLLGSGKAIPVGFGIFELNGFIVVGSDGLFNYTSIDRIKNSLNSETIDNVSDSLINLVRLPSGKLHDDCSVVVYQKGALI